MLGLLGVLTRLEANDDALCVFQQSLERIRALDACWFFTNFIAEVVAIAARKGDLYRAARLSGFVEEGWNLIGTDAAPCTKTRYQHSQQLVRSGLSTREFHSEREQGTHLTLSEAIEEALNLGNDRH